MKIIEIKTHLLEKKLSSTMQISRGGFNIRNHCIVEVITDEGVVGLGEGVGNARLIKHILDQYIGELALGLDPRQIEVLRKQLFDSEVYYEKSGSTICAASAVEMACWDIKAKALNVPLYELLGGCIQPCLTAYASDVYWQEQANKMADNAARIVDLGYKIVKVHIGYDTPEGECKRVRGIRDAIGDEVQLLLDLNAGYSGYDARRAIGLWRDYNISWLEEPVSANTIDALADLRSHSPLPIAAGENVFRIHGFKALFDRAAVDVAMPDIGRAGGIQECKNISALADAYGVMVSPHNFSSGILLAATLHLMASTPNCQWLEMDSSNNAVYGELLTQPLSFIKGRIEVPHQPGLGVHLPEQILARFKVA